MLIAQKIGVYDLDETFLHSFSRQRITDNLEIIAEELGIIRQLLAVTIGKSTPQR